MIVFRRCPTALALLTIFLRVMCIYSQDSITFSPDAPLCVGERVEMICYIEPPAGETFAFSTASVSFNGTFPATLTQINANGTLGGIDLTRYSANTEGLNPTTARPAIRLIIYSYLPYDSDTLFGCHGTFSDSSISDAIVSGMPMRPAGPIASIIVTCTINILPDCAIHVSCTATDISSNRLTDLTYTFTLRDDTTVLETVTVVSDSLSHNITFSTTFTVDVCYSVTVSVKNCANQEDGATTTPTYFSLPGVRNTTGNLLLTSTGSSPTWQYTDTSCPNKEDISIPDDLFSFYLIMDNTIVHTVTEFTLNLPDGFNFTIPNNYDLINDQYFMRIGFCNQNLTDEDIRISVIPEISTIVTIILAVLLSLLAVLFLIILLFILLFLFFFFYKKRNFNK